MKKFLFFSAAFLIGLTFVSLASCERTKPLPTISITADNIPWDHKTPCVVTYCEGKDCQDLEAKIKCRGGYSSGFPKHSFTVKLEEKRSLAGLPAQRSYILNANYIDKTMMHHKLCFDLFREMNPKKNLAPLCAYVNVNKNGEYFGLYVLMQKLNAGSLGLDKSDSLALIFKDPPVFFGENRLEYIQEPGNYFQQNYPDIEKVDMNGYLEEVMQFMIQADDSTFAQKIGELFDLDNLIDWHLLLSFVNNGDGVMKNFYLYKRDSHTPFRLAIWDYDDAFGRDGEGELKMTESFPNFEKCLILRRLRSNPYLNYEENLRKRYKELRDSGIFSKDHVIQLIEENHEIIKDDVARNFEKWPVNGIGYYDANTYEEDVKVMYDYLDIRIPQMDEEMGYTR